MSAVGRLWRRAPVWRAVLMGAVLASGLAVLYGPLRATGPVMPGPAGSYHAAPSRVSAPPPGSGAGVIPPFPGAVPDVGRTFSATMPFAGRLLPLPPGVWTVVMSQSGGNAQGQTLAIAIVAQISGTEVRAALIALGSAVADLTHGGFDPMAECHSPNPIEQAVIEEEARGKQVCWTLGTFGRRFWEARSVPIERAAAEMARRGAVLPSLMVGVLFHTSDRDHWADLRYMFAPAVPIPRGDPDWGRPAVLASAEKLAVVAPVRRWIDRFMPLALRSFTGELVPGDIDERAAGP